MVKGQEIIVGEWYEISRGTNQYEKAIFDDVHKICMAKNGRFQTEEYRDSKNAEDYYLINRYEFYHRPKAECEEREKLKQAIYSNEKKYLKEDKRLVRKIEAIDEKLDISFHNGKYGERC